MEQGGFGSVNNANVGAKSARRRGGRERRVTKGTGARGGEGEDHRIMRHDFTGRWLAECRAIGCHRSCVLHVSCMEGDRVWRVEGEEERKSVFRNQRRRGEHLIRKQMSLPKHALLAASPRVLHIYFRVCVYIIIIK